MAGTLIGKVAIVTGGNSGIGEATVHRLAREGARVAILARRRPEGLAVEEAVRAAGGEAAFIACDMLERSAIESAVAQTVDRYGALHILFNNAGGGGPQRFPEPDDADFERVLRLNLVSTYIMTQVAWAHLVAAGGGSIVNMSSLAAVAGIAPAWCPLAPGFPPPAYSAAKAGIEALTRWTASTGAAVNIRCNAVRPGQIVTPGTSARTPGHHALERVFDQFQVTSGPGYAEDVANAVYFFASDESRFVNGQILDIDGGASAKL
jgi:NAD(P)-dependent dehydrogenase (short-subunit alcohol dehydrogenase family)